MQNVRKVPLSIVFKINGLYFQKCIFPCNFIGLLLKVIITSTVRPFSITSHSVLPSFMLYCFCQQPVLILAQGKIKLPTKINPFKIGRTNMLAPIDMEAIHQRLSSL